MDNVQRASELTAKELDAFVARVRSYEGPLLSLYANVHPAQRETLSQPVAIRAKNTLREMDEVPDQLRTRVLSYFENRLPQAQAVALFGNAAQLELLELDVPIDDPPDDRLNAHYGVPTLAPLLEAIQQNSPRLAVFADRDNVHVFRVFMGRAEQVFEQTRATTAGEQDDIDLSKGRMSEGVKTVRAPAARSPQTAGHQQNGPQYVADRGDAAKQLTHERVEHSQLRFYKECAQHFRELLSETPTASLVILGPERDRHLMLSALPNQLSKQVGALLACTASGAPDPNEVVELVRRASSDMDARQGEELLDAIAERGVQGIEPCLTALQEGRLHRLAIPASLSVSAYQQSKGDYVTTHEAGAKRLGAGEVVEVALASKLPELADRWGASIELLRGEQERRLIEELGGLGGLRRW